MIDVPPPAPEATVHVGNHFSHNSHHSHGVGHGSSFGTERAQSKSSHQGPQSDHSSHFRSLFDKSSFEPATAQSGSRPPSISPTSSEKPAGSNNYTVQQGDSLWQISNRMRSGGDTRNNWDIMGEIARDNGIKNPDMLTPGQGLNLRGPMGPNTPAKDPSSPINNVSSALPGARADGLPGAKGDGIRHISQYTPAGADAKYTNADQNCGPAIMAMIARSQGKGAGMTDAQLINELGKVGHTDATGTSGNGLIAMADQMGLKSESIAGANTDWVKSQLQQGKRVIANGDFHAVDQREDPTKTSAHYILVAGMDQNGNFMVEDPADGNLRLLTPAQLADFTNSNPEGGFNIAVG